MDRFSAPSLYRNLSLSTQPTFSPSPTFHVHATHFALNSHRKGAINNHDGDQKKETRNFENTNHGINITNTGYYDKF